MDGHKYVHDPENNARYAALLCDGSTNGIRLYHSMWKIDHGDMYFGTGKLQKTLSTLEYYTLITPDGEMHHVKRLSDVAKLFPEQKKQIRQMARKNHLSFSKTKRESSLVNVVSRLEGENNQKLEARGEKLENTLTSDKTASEGKEVISHLSPLAPQIPLTPYP